MIVILQIVYIPALQPTQAASVIPTQRQRRCALPPAMIEKGADSVKINKLLFETKSRGRLEIRENGA